MWSGEPPAPRRLVALDIGDPDLRDALAEALEAHPALAPAAGDPPDVTIADRAVAGRDGPALRLGDALPADADVALILSAAHLAAAGFGLRPAPPARDRPRPALSPREREVLAWLVQGAPDKAVARELGVSARTAKFHVASILAKLGARNRAEAVAVALRDGLVAL